MSKTDPQDITALPSKHTLREARQFINDLFVSNSGEGMKFVERLQYVLEPKSTEFDIERHFLVEEAFGYKYENLVKSMYTKIYESKWSNSRLFRYFNPESTIQAGQKLDSLNDLEKLNMVGKNNKCTIEEGKIYLIYVWSVYKPICKKQLSFLNNLFQDHNWENNVSFITINTDKNRAYAQKLIKLLQCERLLENLYIDEEKFPHHPLFNVAHKYGYPVSILVNSDGIIELCGSLFEINLEEKIESLLKRERKKNDIEGELNAESLKLLKTLCRTKLQERLDKHKHDINAVHLYGATLKIKCVYQTGKDYRFMDEFLRKGIPRKILAELDYYAHSSDIEILDYIFEGFNVIQGLRITRNVVETFEIPYVRVPICCVCKKACAEAFAEYFEEKAKIEEMTKNLELPTERKGEEGGLNQENPPEPKQTHLVVSHNASKVTDLDIKNNRIRSTYFSNISNSFDQDEEDEGSFNTSNYYSYYYCYKCNENYCFKCGNLMTDLQSISRLHNHFLFYITTHNRIYSKYILLYNIETEHEQDFRYFFENAKTEKFNEIACHYMVKCDACLQFPIKTTRWKCCNCVSKNLCDKCKIKLETKSEGYEDSLWNLHHVGCDPIQHVFMKIIFDCFVY